MLEETDLCASESLRSMRVRAQADVEIQQRMLCSPRGRSGPIILDGSQSSNRSSSSPGMFSP